MSRKPFFYDVTLRDGNQALKKPWNTKEKEAVFKHVNVHQEHKRMTLKPGSMAFTYCQVPIIYKLGNANSAG